MFFWWFWVAVWYILAVFWSAGWNVWLANT